MKFVLIHSIETNELSFAIAIFINFIAVAIKQKYFYNIHMRKALVFNEKQRKHSVGQVINDRICHTYSHTYTNAI